MRFTIGGGLRRLILFILNEGGHIRVIGGVIVAMITSHGLYGIDTITYCGASSRALQGGLLDRQYEV